MYVPTIASCSTCTCICYEMFGKEWGVAKQNTAAVLALRLSLLSLSEALVSRRSERLLRPAASCENAVGRDPTVYIGSDI